MPTVIMTRGELYDFPLASDHAFSAGLSHLQRVRYMRGEDDASRLQVSEGAVSVRIRALDKSDINRITRSVRPRESHTGRKVLAQVRQVARVAYQAELDAATKESRSPDPSVQEDAAMAAVDALSDADREAYEQNTAHELARAYALADACIDSINLGDGRSIREVLGDDFSSHFDGEGYPTRWVLNSVLLPAWEAQRVDFLERANEAIKAAVEAQHDATEALRKAAGDAAFVAMWPLVGPYQGAVIASNIAESGAADEALAESRKAAEKFGKTTAPDALDAWVTLLDATKALAECRCRWQWFGADDPDAVALEIARHIERAAMLPKARLT